MGRSAKADLETRRTALDLLLRVEKGAFLDALLGPAIEETADRREAALLTRLVYGVETWRGRLDWTLAAFASRGLAALDPPVRSALRLGLFQIWFLDRVPNHAAVDTSVELAKAHSPGGARLVNAILRRAVREGERPPPAREADLAAHLAIRWSHPAWLVREWLDQRGPEATESLLAANDLAGPSAFRVDLRSSSREEALTEIEARGIPAAASPYADTAITIDGPVGEVRPLRALEPQGVASQIVTRMLDVAPEATVLDLCAAPGGKSAALAEAHPRAHVVAADRVAGGLRRAARLRTDRPNLSVLRADGTRPPLGAGRIDAVLVDAPCSGLGTLRSHPDLRWRRNLEDVARLGALQRRLLASAATLVRPGGQMVYATCTLLAQENESTVDAFLADHPTWVREDVRPRLGPAAQFVGEDLALRTSPDRDGLDGFFAVALRRPVAHGEGPGK